MGIFVGGDSGVNIVLVVAQRSNPALPGVALYRESTVPVPEGGRGCCFGRMPLLLFGPEAGPVASFPVGVHQTVH